MSDYEPTLPPLKSEMTCGKCIYGKTSSDHASTIECRAFPNFVDKKSEDWCANGLWRTFSKNMNCWVNFYIDEGRDD